MFVGPVVLRIGDSRPLTTGPNYDADRGWLRFRMFTFDVVQWAPAWGGHLELWGEHDVYPAIAYLPTPGRTILLEYGDHHWWGFPIPVQTRSLYLYEATFYSDAPPEEATAPHVGFPHPKGALLQ
jgi:hypothetical protein